MTQIEPARKFWRGEDYRRQYFAERGMAYRCHQNRSAALPSPISYGAVLAVTAQNAP